MGRQKVAIERVVDERARQVTFCKRKKGLLKKAMELSLLCGVKIFLVMHDLQERKVLQYQAEPDDNLPQFLKDNYSKIYVFNKDYHSISNGTHKGTDLRKKENFVNDEEILNQLEGSGQLEKHKLEPWEVRVKELEENEPTKEDVYKRLKSATDAISEVSNLLKELKHAPQSLPSPVDEVKVQSPVESSAEKISAKAST